MKPWSCRLAHVTDGVRRFSYSKGAVSQHCSVALYLKVISLPMIFNRRFAYSDELLDYYIHIGEQVQCTFDNDMCALNYISEGGDRVYLGYLEENSPWYVVEAIADKLNTAYILDRMGAE